MIQFVWIVALLTCQIDSGEGLPDAIAYTQPMTWNDANQYCKSIGLNLLTINRLAKSKLIEDQHINYYFIIPEGFQFWIGLHKVDSNGDKYMWSDTCSSINFENWSENKNDTLPNLCGYIDITTSMQWNLAPCNSELKPFACEYQRHICQSGYWYEVFGHRKGLADTGYTVFSADIDSCEKMCDDVALNSSCWGFLYNLHNHTCKLYDVIDNPFYNDVHSRTTENFALYIRRCEFFVFTDYSQSLTVDSDKKEVVSQCPSYENRENVTTVEIFGTTVTDITIRTTTLLDDEATVISTKLSETSIAMVTATTPSSTGNTPFCECKCSNVTVSLTLEESIAKIVNFLKIDETKTSASIRRRTSANDHRPSSANIGYLGIAVISVPFIFILVLDVLSFFAE